MAHQAGVYPGFRNMKRLGEFLLLPGWDVSPSQGYPQRKDTTQWLEPRPRDPNHDVTAPPMRHIDKSLSMTVRYYELKPLYVKVNSLPRSNSRRIKQLTQNSSERTMHL